MYAIRSYYDQMPSIRVQLEADVAVVGARHDARLRQAMQPGLPVDQPGQDEPGHGRGNQGIYAQGQKLATVKVA